MMIELLDYMEAKTPPPPVPRAAADVESDTDAPARQESDPITEFLERGDVAFGGLGISGPGSIFVNLNRSQAVMSSTAYRCMQLISCEVASLPIAVIDPDGRELTLAKLTKRTSSNASVRKFLELIQMPDGMTEYYDFMTQLVGNLCFDGNAFLIYYTDYMGDLELVELASTENVYIDLMSDDPKSTKFWLSTERTPWRPYYASMVKHLAFTRLRQMQNISGAAGLYPYHHRFGVSPVFCCMRGINLDLRANNYVGEFFSTNLKSTLTLSTDQPLNTKQLNMVQERVVAASKGRWPMVLGNGFSATQINNEPQGENLKELREFQVEEIARAFGVPPPLVGKSITQWGSGLESLYRLYVKGCLSAYTSRIAATFTSFLPPGHKFVFIKRKLYEDNMQHLAMLLDKAKDYFTVDEGRDIIGLAKREKDFKSVTSESPMPAPKMPNSSPSSKN